MMKIVLKLFICFAVVFSCSGIINGCKFDGKTYETGDLRWEECNSCTCGEDGNWFCTIIGCPTGVCYYNGQEYKDGQTFKNDCNTCTCSAKNADEVGYVACTEIGCPSKSPCQFKGKVYDEGSVRYEDCNSCSCAPNGEWLCTTIKCPTGFCYHNGEKYQDGQTFKIDCNSCVCAAKKADRMGTARCTLKGCLSKSFCFEEREKWKTSPIGIPPPGAFVPKCNPDGSYTDLQCHASINECWCVDPASGKEKPGTRTKRGEPKPICSCVTPCPRTYKPVCGSDGRTYANDCELKNAQCKDKSLFKKHEFTCKDDIGNGKITLKGKILLPPKFPQTVPKGSCLTVKILEELLCEGIDCDVPVLSSILLRDPKVLADGSIPYILQVKKIESPYIVEVSLGMGRCIGPEDSIKAGDYFHDIAYSFSAPEDGSLEVTKDISLIGYKITSLSEEAECPKDVPIVACTYEPCAHLICNDNPKAVCKPNFCGGCNAEFFVGNRKVTCGSTRCSQGCPFNYDPVCGSDGKTYSNDCTFKVAQCEVKGKDLYLQSPGACPDDNKSCLAHNKRESDRGAVGNYVPQCDENGLYKNRQCHGSTGYCWCVDPASGKEIEGTKTGPGKTPVDCNKEDSTNDEITVKGNILFPPTIPAVLPKDSCLTVKVLEERLCEGRYEDCDVPILSSNQQEDPKLLPGYVIPYQLSVKKLEVPYIIEASLSMGWCKGPDDSIKAGDYFHDTAYSFSAPEDGSLEVTKDISLIKYKITSLSEEADDNKLCLAHNKRKSDRGAVGNYVPQCDENGLYKNRQCHGSTGYCWCVDPASGKEIEGTKTGPGKTPVDCNKEDSTNDKITVKGNILIPPTIPAVLPKGSCLTVKVLEERLCEGGYEDCDVPILSSTQQEDPKLLPGYVIPYQLSVKKLEVPYIIEASLSMGWCRGPEDSIKAGDYFHDIAYSFSAPEDGTFEVTKDISLIGYKIVHSGYEKKCAKVCPFIYLPVCSSDGRTLDNECLFEIEKCKKPSLEVAHQGPCRECPKDVPIVTCSVNPCDTAICPSSPDAECRANYCGGCNAEFFKRGRKVICAPRLGLKVGVRALATSDGDRPCPSVCPALYNPICGSDRKTHSSECHLKLEACTTRSTIFKMHNGPCGYCKKHCNRRSNPKCGSDGLTYGNRCELDRAICKSGGKVNLAYDGSCDKPRCRPICPAIYVPQCGSDGVTYSSLCVLQAKSCATDGKVKFAYPGKCRVCSAICTREYDPYCGTDGKTHGNKCEMNYAICKSGGRVQLKYKGECENPSCPRKCPRRHSGAVCGTDGKVYRSLCKLQKKTCQTNGQVYLRHFGDCEKRCQRFRICTYEYNPQCGTNGKTYSNMCSLRGAMCRSNGAVRRAHGGECRECPKGVPIVGCKSDPCQQAYCPKYPRAVCRANFCGSCNAQFFNRGKKIEDCGTTCSAACTKEFFPQCGSDGKTYGNRCLLAYAKCQSKGKVWLLYSGQCKTRFYKK